MKSDECLRNTPASFAGSHIMKEYPGIQKSELHKDL